jgi:subtilase family serine protease
MLARALLSMLVLTLAPSLRAEPPVIRFLPQASGAAALRGVAESIPLSRVDAVERLAVAIGLPARNQPELSALLRELHDPASPAYHAWLTPEAFTARFGPAEADYARLTAWAEAMGLRVVETAPNRLMLNLSGTTADIEHAFGVRMHRYQHPSGRSFRSPDRPPSLDLDLPVATIDGLNDFCRPAPQAEPAGPGSAPVPNSGSGAGGTCMGQDFRAAYCAGVPATTNGAGQNIALLQFSTYDHAGPRRYWMDAAMAAPAVTDVPVAGGALDSFGNAEVALDIEIAGAMAPGAHLFVYMGTDGNSILNRIATDNTCRQVGISWLWKTGAMDGPGSVDPTQDAIFRQMDAQGIACFVSAGDSGPWSPGPGHANAVNPADEPTVTCVGGTVLATPAPGGPWSGETAWPQGGGGSSRRYPLPAYQAGMAWARIPGASPNRRNAPDVAAIADNVYVDSGMPSGGQAQWGTSCGAPLWAAFSALANQAAASQGKPALGFLNPLLYRIGRGLGSGSAFHDITHGGDGRSAAPGFDLATGWGSPVGQSTLDALLAPPGGTP